MVEVALRTGSTPVHLLDYQRRKQMPNRRTVKRRGFTLVELVTVLAVVMTLAAVAVPAMQSARTSARNLHCRNNLKQIGLALHNYHETFRILPPGWTSNHGEPDAQGEYGWQSSILPYIEQIQMYDQIDFNQGLPAASGSLQANIRIYRCISDRTPATNPLRGNYGTSNYTGNYGDTSPSRWLPGRFSQYWPGQTQAALGRMAKPRPSGFFWLDSAIGFRDVTDGLSNTIMASERSFEFGAGIWPGVGDNSMETDQVSDGSFASPINRSLTGFSSAHSGGTNILMGDGSARFISTDISTATAPNRPPGVLQKITNRDDGEITNLETDLK